MGTKQEGKKDAKKTVIFEKGCTTNLTKNCVNFEFDVCSKSHDFVSILNVFVFVINPLPINAINFVSTGVSRTYKCTFFGLRQEYFIPPLMIIDSLGI